MSDRGMAHLILSRRGYSAITFGHVVVSTREPADTIWRHERGHVRQYEQLGCAFLPLYLLLYQQRGYRDHPLERDASQVSTILDR